MPAPGWQQAVLSDSIGKVMASSPSDKVKIIPGLRVSPGNTFSLIVDDGSPVDRYFMNSGL